jgi:hypothetical protein
MEKKYKYKPYSLRLREFMAGKQYGDRQREQLIAIQKEQRMVAR